MACSNGPRHSHIFHQSLSYLAMNNLELFLGPVLLLFDRIQECETHREASKTIIPCFYSSQLTAISAAIWKSFLASLRTVQWWKWDQDNCLTLITNGGIKGPYGSVCLKGIQHFSNYDSRNLLSMLYVCFYEMPSKLTKHFDDVHWTKHCPAGSSH